MILTQLRIENFRMFGEGDKALVVDIRPGLTAIVGENDSGKTAIIDALRLALGTRDQDFLRIVDSDFHQNGGISSTEVRICCKFEKLTRVDCAWFLEYLTYELVCEERMPMLYLNWKATYKPGRDGKRRIGYEVRTGSNSEGPVIDMDRRELLFTTYLRPLRDAERALASGRGSRLSQILLNTNEIKAYGREYEEGLPPEEYAKLSVLGIGTLADALLSKHTAVLSTRNRLNEDYLDNLVFGTDTLKGHISVSSVGRDDDTRLRQLLEKFELELGDDSLTQVPTKRGLGSNNLLFIACELLLAGPNSDGPSLLLIEEPEAHLHPQRQLRLMQFLQTQAGEGFMDEKGIQVIVTTHSPNLASVIDLDNIVLMNNGNAYSLAHGKTGLTKSDYGFLARFLDVTKANLFFARAVIIVEGDSESILLPTLARLIGVDLTRYGVSIVNVGGTGLRRFARIFLRADADKVTDCVAPGISIPVACVADFDVMPDCAPKIIGITDSDDKDKWPEKRRWKVESDFGRTPLYDRREALRGMAHSQSVRTFVSDKWTLEYDLAYSGLAEEVWMAAHLARQDEQINAGRVKGEEVCKNAAGSFAVLKNSNPSQEELASHVYALFVSGSKVSKPIAAQYLAALLQNRAKTLACSLWENRLPPYLVQAIRYVVQPSTTLI